MSVAKTPVIEPRSPLDFGPHPIRDSFLIEGFSESDSLTQCTSIQI